MKYVKNQSVKVEYGTYGNFATLTPIDIVETHKTYVVMLFKFQNGSTIKLCPDNNKVDFESFGIKR